MRHVAASPLSPHSLFHSLFTHAFSPFLHSTLLPLRILFFARLVSCSVHPSHLCRSIIATYFLLLHFFIVLSFFLSSSPRPEALSARPSLPSRASHAPMHVRFFLLSYSTFSHSIPLRVEYSAAVSQLGCAASCRAISRISRMTVQQLHRCLVRLCPPLVQPIQLVTVVQQASDHEACSSAF